MASVNGTQKERNLPPRMMMIIFSRWSKHTYSNQQMVLMVVGPDEDSNGRTRMFSNSQGASSSLFLFMVIMIVMVCLRICNGNAAIKIRTDYLGNMSINGFSRSR